MVFVAALSFSFVMLEGVEELVGEQLR